MSSLRALLLLLALGLIGCPPGGTDDDDASNDDDVTDDDDATGDDDDAVDDDDVADDDDSTMPDAADVQLDGFCPSDRAWGKFQVESLPEYSAVQGQVSEGVVPNSILEVVIDSGGCLLLRRDNPFCDPACEPGFTCDFDGTCIPYPETQNLGTVSIDGLTAPVDMDPVQPGNNYFAVGLPLQITNPNETVRLRTEGGAFDPITLWGVGLEDLVLPEELQWSVDEGQPLDLTWPAAAPGARSQMLFSLNIDQHGVSPATLFCEFPDTGSATVPAEVISGLFGVGVSGFPFGALTRRTVDSEVVGDNGEGCVEFAISSPRSVDVDVVGYIPCDLMTPCPDGLECNLEIGLCL
ncbi:MAG: hypothetical protein KDA24_12855 [Deltaproteobacteria bacterium]|nr:hypothetical protein [Deltaproteobacteria bacterium]